MTVHLPSDLKRSLRATALREGRSQADLIRAALFAYLDSPQAGPNAFIGVGADDEVTGFESEDFLRSQWSHH